MLKEPQRINSQDWESLMPKIPQEYRDKCKFLRNCVQNGVPYLFSHYEYSCRGDTLLRRLKFDSGLASLRLWAFIFSEKDRLFLAKENGWKIFAAMKDLGVIPVICYAVPESLTFCADELWWAPCFAEETYLLDEASKLGATEELCYIRALLGAYKTLDYFPKPDISFAGVGACCDDFTAVMQLIEWQGNPIHYWEIPSRFDKCDLLKEHTFETTFSGGSVYQKSAKDFLVTQFKGIIKKLEQVTGRNISERDLLESIKNFNIIRKKVSNLRELVYKQKNPPLPGLEMYLTEFIAPHACSEPLEAHNVLDELTTMVQNRIEKGQSPLGPEPVRVFWVTPPTDAALITLLEDCGGCVCGTEYLISHTLYQLDEKKPPLEAIAENYMDDPLLGTSEFRALRIVNEAKRFGAEGVMITGIFGASHCAYEERVIREAVQKELDIPVVAFDVPYSPGKLSEQVVNRIQGFTELLRSRRRTRISFSEAVNISKKETVNTGNPLEYFKNGRSHETDYVREEKRKGKGIVGIYCEFTPRDLIMAAGAIPVCLCGDNQRTVASAETVLPANLCPLIKSSFGYILTGRCPFYVVSDLIVAETTCDGKKKMYENIAERKDTHILELTQKVEEGRAFTHWFDEVKELKEKLEKKFNITITDEKLKNAILRMNRERKLITKALRYGKYNPSIVTGKELSLLRYRTSGNPDNLKNLERFIDLMEQRIKDGYTAVPSHSSRVLLTGCPTTQDTDKVIEIIEESGGVVVVQEACSGIKPVEELVEEHGDPLEAIARKHFNIPCSCMTPNKGRTELIRRLAEEFQANAVVDLIWQTCLTYSVESFFIERFVQNELGLPYIKIETDYSTGDIEQIRVRIQTLLEIC